MSDAKIRSFAITIRPRDGIDNEQIIRFVTWVKKHCTYHHVITEKKDHERHVHAGIFLKKAKTHSNLSTDILRLFKDLDTQERSTLRGGIKKMYNIDFIKNYMEKDDDTVVVDKNLPEEATLDMYFAEIPSPKKKGPKATDPLFSHLESLWWTYKRPIEETNPENLRHFLMNMMNNERKIRVIQDNRKIFSLSCALSRYINKETQWQVTPEVFHQDL